jgi:hypothetical protein
MTRLVVSVVSGFLLVLLGSPVTRGQVVQLPTFQSFSVSTTVSVPDSGGVALGGVARMRSSSAYRGIPVFGSLPGAGSLLRNRFITREAGARQAGVSATIIDHREWDETLRRAAQQRRMASPDEVERDRRAAFLSRHGARTGGARQPGAGRPVPSPQGQTTGRSSAGLAQQASPRHDTVPQHYLALGDEALAKGDYERARYYYELATRASQAPSP